MSDDDEQLRVRVAWLYFMEGLTQADIAAKLGITRLRANRLLGEARESGLVNIQVNARLADCVALERAAGRRNRPEGRRDRADPGRSRADRGRARPRHGRLSRPPSRREPRARRSASAGAPPCARPSATCASANLPDLSINSMMGGLTHGLGAQHLRDRQRVRPPRQRAVQLPRRADLCRQPAARATPSWRRTCSARPSSGSPPSTSRC